MLLERRTLGPRIPSITVKVVLLFALCASGVSASAAVPRVADHATPIGPLVIVFGARSLFCSCVPVADYA